MTPDPDIIRFNVLRNALYHSGMALAFSRRNRFVDFLIVLLGVVTMVDASASPGVGQVWLGVAIVTVSALRLVFDFSRMARFHRALKEDYYRLLAEIEACPTDDEACRAQWWGQMIAIAGDEPPVLRARDAKAYNDALDSLDIHDKGERLVIPWYQRLFGSLFSYEGHHYRKRSELPGWQPEA